MKGLEAFKRIYQALESDLGENVIAYWEQEEDMELVVKELKAFDIINNKEVNMSRFKAVEMLNGNADEYNKSEDYESRYLTQEEYDLLKEVLYA